MTFLYNKDTRPPVADGWAGAEMRVSSLFDSMVTDGPTDGPTDRQTDKASYKVACPQLKRGGGRGKRRKKGPLAKEWGW